MKRGFRCLWLCQRGAAMIEFTLVAPMLIFLTSGIIQFGYIFYIQNTMQNLARDAARGVAVGELTASGSNVSCPGGAVGSAEEMVCNGVAGFSGNFTVNVTNPPDAGDDVIAIVTLPMADAAVMDVLGVLDSGTITTEATMRKE
jgi:hypothetical protein